MSSAAGLAGTELPVRPKIKSGSGSSSANGINSGLEKYRSSRRMIRGPSQALQRRFNTGLMIMAFGLLAGTKHRSDQFSPEAFKERPRPVAVVVMVVKGKLLWPMGFIFRMVQVQNNHCGNFGITADELIHQNLSRTIEVA